eukprot:TRINITY_DN111846_c0_g1_i1.p1 TRINITY_DN111846_c0_g1~~TRINITY_DN111846_c0_g1_i1.p1  ORF type:complete len:486 (+),score=55.79 TRINITY_DN111846_c0_g1_i1:124-1581(+)
MTSLSQYQLYWWDLGTQDGDEDCHSCPDQFVFTTGEEMPFSLSRVKSLHDLQELLSRGESEAHKVAVAFVALLGGNLVAMGEWEYLLCFVAVGLTVAVLQLRRAAWAMAGLLMAFFFNTVWKGLVSLEWLLTVALVVLLAVMSVVMSDTLSKEDPRGYVLLPEQPSDTVVIRNHCYMDVKLLVFDGYDAVRLIPYGGLLGGTLLPRAGSCILGINPPYIIKVYAPWGKEVGAFRVPSLSVFGLRATAPPLLLRRCRYSAQSRIGCGGPEVGNSAACAQDSLMATATPAPSSASLTATGRLKRLAGSVGGSLAAGGGPAASGSSMASIDGRGQGRRAAGGSGGGSTGSGISMRSGSSVASLVPPATSGDVRGKARFRNRSEDVSVLLGISRPGDWTSSLWIPLTGIAARLLRQTSFVPPGKEVSLPVPCVIRVYTGLGGIREEAYCTVWAGELVDYVGGMKWGGRTASRPLLGSRRSMSALFSFLR